MEKEKEPEDIIVKLQQEIKQVQLVCLCPNIPHPTTLKLSLVPPPLKLTQIVKFILNCIKKVSEATNWQNM